MCSNNTFCKLADCQIRFTKSFASNPRSLFWSVDNEKQPIDYFRYSSEFGIFDCPDCDHVIRMRLRNVSAGRWCVYCAHTKLCFDVDCITCYEKSFASHPKSIYCKTDKNLRDYFKNSQEVFTFQCDLCPHEFQSNLNNINGGKWCGYCNNKILCSDKNCKPCYEKSFASHTKAEFWSQDNLKYPRECFKGTDVKYLFDCPECKHKISKSPNSISSGSWCSYCVNKKLCIDETCEYCYDKSFANHSKAKFWNPDNKLTARHIFKNYSGKISFICDSGHIFNSSPNAITFGSWCPYCKNKTEGKLQKWLVDMNYLIESQVKFEWTKTEKSYKRYDFYLPKEKIIIELDGRQHFEQVSNWSTPEEAKINDSSKNELALKNGFHMIRIFQKSVLNDHEDWVNELTKTIKLLSETKIPKLIKLGEIYNNH